ncbi:hypothetical protein ACJX0J_014442, partial [Zea mays]
LDLSEPDEKEHHKLICAESSLPHLSYCTKLRFGLTHNHLYPGALQLACYLYDVEEISIHIMVIQISIHNMLITTKDAALFLSIFWPSNSFKKHTIRYGWINP